MKQVRTPRPNADGVVRGARTGLPTDLDTLWTEMVTILLAFQRFTPEQIARCVGVDVATVELLRNDPDTLDLVRDMRALLPQPGEINELLMSDAERNIRWLRRLRDGSITGDPKELNVRQRAAVALLDRQVPKKLSVAVEMAPSRVIDVSPDQMQRMRGLLRLPDRFSEAPMEVEEAEAVAAVLPPTSPESTE